MMIESHIAVSKCTPLKRKKKKITDKMNSSSTEASSQPPMIPIILTSIYDSSENICKPQVVYCGTGWFLTGTPDFQYQKEKTCSANEELFYIENFVKN